jgi:hypothetical protein
MTSSCRFWETLQTTAGGNEEMKSSIDQRGKPAEMNPATRQLLLIPRNSRWVIIRAKHELKNGKPPPPALPWIGASPKPEGWACSISRAIQQRSTRGCVLLLPQLVFKIPIFQEIKSP